MQHEYTLPTEDTVDGSIDLVSCYFGDRWAFLKSTPARIHGNFVMTRGI
jgi:hypothetical protein